MKNKHLFIVLGVLLIVLLLVILLIIKTTKLSKIEKIKIEDTSSDIMLFYEEIDNKEVNDTDGYIAYALEYSYNVNDKSELTTKEIKELIESKFNIKLEEDKINDVGITPYLLKKNISHDTSEKKYSIDKSILTQQDISEIPITKYEITNIKKKGKKYIVTYDKYVVKNPYEIMNYYSDLNVQSEEEETTYDTSEILNYLTCKGKITSVKKILTKDDLETLAKKEKSIEIKYILVDGNLKIDNSK
ncbi:MAG: hypothetical protein II625_02665 [Bacilli bacterium]|nr:hypothetical protein [Bacilli bacterium]